jgi:hypothetical protein
VTDWENIRHSPLHDAIGGVAANSAFMEAVLVALYGRMLRSPHSAVVVAGMSYRAASEGCVAILESLSPANAMVGQIRRWIEHASQLQSHRNRVVHAVWTDDGTKQATDGAPVYDSVLSKRKNPKGVRREQSLTELHALAQEIDMHTFQLTLILTKDPTLEGLDWPEEN